MVGHYIIVLMFQQIIPSYYRKENPNLIQLESSMLERFLLMALTVEPYWCVFWILTQKQWQVTYLLAVTSIIIMLVFSTKKIVTFSAPWALEIPEELMAITSCWCVSCSNQGKRRHYLLAITSWCMLLVFQQKVTTERSLFYQASVWTYTTSRHVMSQPRNESLHTNRIHASWSTWITTYWRAIIIAFHCYE